MYKRQVIDLFLKDGLIYESRHYHNVVFKGNDKNGETRFASMRGVFDKQGKPFKCDVTGNDKNYGFNVVNVNSTEIVVFEAAIDLMSYVDIFADYESNKLALGMLAVSYTHLDVYKRQVHTLTVKAGQTTGISATDKEQLGAITIYKEGEVLSSWNLSLIHI